MGGWGGHGWDEVLSVLAMAQDHGFLALFHFERARAVGVRTNVKFDAASWTARVIGRDDGAVHQQERCVRAVHAVLAVCAGRAGGPVGAVCPVQTVLTARTVRAVHAILAVCSWQAGSPIGTILTVRTGWAWKSVGAVLAVRTRWAGKSICAVLAV